MIIIKIFYTIWIFNYSLIEKSFKKDAHWDGRSSSVGAAAFGNMVMLIFIIFYQLEKYLPSKNIQSFFSVKFPLYPIGLIGSLIAFIVFGFLFSFLKRKSKNKIYRLILFSVSYVNRVVSYVIQVIILLLFFYTLSLIAQDMY